MVKKKRIWLCGLAFFCLLCLLCACAGKQGAEEGLSLIHI